MLIKQIDKNEVSQVQQLIVTKHYVHQFDSMFRHIKGFLQGRHALRTFVLSCLKMDLFKAETCNEAMYIIFYNAINLLSLFVPSGHYMYHQFNI